MQDRKPMVTIVILNGPNLNLIGKRQTDIYGNISMEKAMLEIQYAYPDLQLNYYQSNHEGQLIDWLQEIGLHHTEKIPINDDVTGIVLNAGGYTHTSVALRDTVIWIKELGIPIVEVHISDIYTREPFRANSLLSDVCSHTITGHGISGYKEAITWILKNNKN